MAKRNYTHVQALLPEITAMLAEGKTQREAAEHFGLKDKYVVKGLLKRQREYPVSAMCKFFGVSRSGYYAFAHRLGRPEKDAALAGLIAQHRECCFATYGCRRMWLALEKRGIHRNPKTILRIMEKCGLLSEIRRRRKWQQMGQQVHKCENLLNRQLHADRPNCKWVTEFSPT